MPLDWLKDYLPVAALVVGIVLLAWSQRSRLAGWSEPEPTADRRFAMFMALRRWCERAGHAEAVKALDGRVLPALVQGESQR